MSRQQPSAEAPSPPAEDAPTAFDAKWPGDPGAVWPNGCIVWDVGSHPQLPWLTMACNKDDFGAIVVIDARSGSMVSAAASDATAGWAHEGLLLWDATGTRLCTNADTGGIAVLEGNRFVGLNHTDDGRDGATHYAWVDHRIYTDTNHLFDPKHDVGWARFDFDPPARKISWTIGGFRWNPEIDAVVGLVRPTDGSGPEARRLMAYAPARDAVVYDRPVGDVGRLQWSSNGRWLLTAERAPSGGPAHVIVIDTDDGHEARRFLPKHEHAGRMSISDRGDVIVASPSRPTKAIELWRSGADPVELPQHDLIDIAWSPDARGVALLDTKGIITLFDVTTAKSLTTIDAPEPKPPKGLPDWAQPKAPFDSHNALLWVSADRFAVVGRYYASIYSIDGSRIAQFIAPM